MFENPRRGKKARNFTTNVPIILDLNSSSGEIFSESIRWVPWVQTERSEVCTSDWGQDSPIQTDLARLIRCLLYGQTRKQRNTNINNFIYFPARVQAFSCLSSVTGLQSRRDKNNCSKSSFVQSSSMNEDKIFHTGSMKKLLVETTIYEKWPKVQLQCK